MSDDQHPPTAKRGMRAAMETEQIMVQQGAPKESFSPSRQQSNAEPRANATGDSMVNPTASQGEPAAPFMTATVPQLDTGWGTSCDLTRASAEHAAFIREALQAYRAMLVGLRARLIGELNVGFAGQLNPEPARAAAEHSLMTVRLGIAKANALLFQLEEEMEAPVP